MSREKILFLTAYVPNKASAGEKNTMLMLNDLASSYDVDLVYYKYDDEESYQPERENVNVVMELHNSIIVKLLNFIRYPIVHPTFSIRFDRRVLRQIKKLMKKSNYKAIILNHSNMFLYGKYLDSKIPKLLFCHDVIAQRVLRSSSLLVAKFCIHSERLLLEQPNAHIFSFSQKDCDLIEKIYGKKANVNLDYIDEKIINVEPKKIEDYFVLFGDWRRKENSLGALWLLNTIGELLHNDIKIKIIGRQFPMDQVKQSNKITIDNLGFVDNPYDIISQSKALISPLFRGAGIKVKVIESLACGTPIIGTEIAFEGLPQEFDDFMILAKTPEEYVQAIEEINFDLGQRKRIKSRFLKAYQSDSVTKVISRL